MKLGLGHRRVARYYSVIATLVALFMGRGLSGCAQRVAVIGLPMVPHAGDTLTPTGGSSARPGSESNGSADGSGGSTSTHTPSKADQAHYWSAFTYIDELAVLRNWGKHSRDHAFLTVRVKLPTREGVLTRDFPLYTIKGSSIQSHQGVDLLQKFPLSAAAREQVTISLEVRYLKNAEALEITRAIVANAEKLAQPYLRNFSVASAIMTSAVALADQLAPKEAAGINTAAFSINPARLRGVHGYLLVAGELHGAPAGAGGTAAPGTNRGAPWPSDLAECTDKPGALCHGHGTYQTSAYLDEVYVTLRFQDRDDVYDPLMLLRGAGVCLLIDESTLEAARAYVRANMSLFVDHDVAIAEGAFAYAEQYLRLRDGVAQENFGGMLDILNEYGVGDTVVRTLLNVDATLDSKDFPKTQPEEMLQTAYDCYKTFWDRTPGREVREAWNLVQVKGDLSTQDGRKARLDALGAVLSRLGAFSGASDWEADGKNNGTVIELLRREARGLIAMQVREIDAQLEKKPKCDEAGRQLLFSLFSGECHECVTKVMEYCPHLEREITVKRAEDRASGIQHVQALQTNPGTTTPNTAPPSGAPSPAGN